MAAFTLDLTEGKSREQLADDYMRALRAGVGWQRIAMSLIELEPTSVAKLPKEQRETVERLIEAYKD